MTGPITGQEVVITMYGTWVDEEDAECLVAEKYPVYCPAVKSFVRKHALFFARPTQQQLKQRPKGI